MTKFLKSILFLVLAGVVLFLERRYSREMPGLVFLSGWTLLAVMLTLAGYSMRKRLTFIPLGSSAAWLSFHIYAGLFAILLFGLHLRWEIPDGWFEAAFAMLFVLVSVSGLVGLWISRNFPKRLTSAGGEVIYERIPEIRRQLQIEAEGIVMSCSEDENFSILADFYLNKVKKFMAGPKHFWHHLIGVSQPERSLLRQGKDLKRYLSDNEKSSLDRLLELAAKKRGLDYHRALQLSLKGWLFVHIPFTWSLLLFSVVHVILIFAYSGGAS